jgi:agmatine deiminase
MSNKNDWQIPAEWAPQDAVWMSWPTYQPLRSKHFTHGPKSTEEVMIEMIKHLVRHVRVSMVVNDEKGVRKFKKMLKEANIPIDNIEAFIVPHCDTWIRDIGGTFITNNKSQDLALIWPRFNLWGYEGHTLPGKGSMEGCDMPNKLPKEMANILDIPVVKRWDYTGEGGDKSFNGKGSMIVSKAVEMQRNPGLAKSELTQLLKSVYNMKKIVYVDKGVVDDDQSFIGPTKEGLWTLIGTGGHIDEFCRFVSARTVILAKVSGEQLSKYPDMKETHLRMEHNLSLLKSQTDQDGNRLRIVRMPLPNPMVYKSLSKGDDAYKALFHLKLDVHLPKVIDVLSAGSYCNYLITNGLVLIPKYRNSQEYNRQSKDIFTRLFPGRKIQQIYVGPVNSGGGGIHCITQQQPSLTRV